jgi:hypothetical protein
LDIIIAPLGAANMVLKGNPELSSFIPYSFQVAFKTYPVVLLNLLVTVKAEHIFGFEFGAIFVLEFRDLNLSVGAVLQRNSKVFAISHFFSPFKNRLLILATNHCRNHKQS